MRKFSFEITLVSDEQDDLTLDSAVMVELPDTTSVDEEQLEEMIRRVASNMGEFLRAQYAQYGVDAEITVCH